MTKIRLNLLVDILAYLGMVAMVSTGLLLMKILPPGTGGCHAEGGARITLLGLSRHEWGKVHWYVAIGLIAVAVMHVLLHWKWITNALSSLLRPSATTIAARAVPLLVLGVLSATVIATPWVVGTETHPGEEVNADHSSAPLHTPKACTSCTFVCPLSGQTKAKETADTEACKDPNCKECSQTNSK